ncbi:Hypothetical_protein [Hexamita inflata]|uniref:Hypothetical_protein n=1 Tax=Hexamita inflata TaxID=28002 RepID=A0AA86V6Z9_9EUKA|nr:Hypothetical protein HINF_LOCUS66362 [Hexamita inflata]
MDSSNSQPSYLSLYVKYINSTPNIYGLKFRSKKANIQNHSAHSQPEIQDSIVNAQPKQITSVEPSIIQEQNNLENDTESNISIINYQQGIDSFCEQQIRTQIYQNNTTRLIKALVLFGTKYQLIAHELQMPVHQIQHQIQNLFRQIEKTTVSDEEWAELSSKIDIVVTDFYHSISENQSNILRTFKAALKVTKNQKFSVQYCCRKFGVEAKLVNAVVRQACEF